MGVKEASEIIFKKEIAEAVDPKVKKSGKNRRVHG
jgi:hypothetical protein